MAIPNAAIQSVLDQPIATSDLYFNGIKMMTQLSQTNFQTWKKKKKSHAQPNLKRVEPSQKPQCKFVSRLYNKTTNPPPADIAKDVLSWPIPNTKGEHVLDLCFWVREVQDFIAQNDNFDEHVQQEQQQSLPIIPTCPMFEQKQIQDIFNSNGLSDYHVPNIMDHDFQIAFIEFDVLPQDKFSKDDMLSEILLEKLKEFVINSTQEVTGNEPFGLESETKNTDETKVWKVAGFFWYATKKTLGLLFNNMLVKGAKLAIWLLKNPNFLKMAIVIVRTVRIVLCVVSSFDEITGAILDALERRLQDVIVGYGWVIWEFARSIIDCITNVSSTLLTTGLAGLPLAMTTCVAKISIGAAKLPLDTIYHWTPHWLRNWASYGASYFANTVHSLTSFFKSMIPSVLQDLGIPLFMGLGKVLSGNEMEALNVLGFGKDATTFESLRLAFLTWDPTQFSLATIILILDFLILVIDAFTIPEHLVYTFAVYLSSRIPFIGAAIVKKLESIYNIMQASHVPTNILRHMLMILRHFLAQEQFKSLIFDALEEIKLFFTDLFPCLIRRIGDMFMYLLSFGTVSRYFTTSGDILETSQFQAPCCLAPIIRTLQRQFAFGELDRQHNVRAQDLKKKRSELSWWDYLASGEGYQAIAQSEQELRGMRNNLSKFIDADYEHGYSELTKENEQREKDIATAQATWFEKLKTQGYTAAVRAEENDVLVPFIRKKQQETNDADEKFYNSYPKYKSYTTRGLGDTLIDTYGSLFYGNTHTMVSDEIICGIPCVEHEYITAHQLPNMCVHMSFANGHLHFYLCVDDMETVWLLSRKDMIENFKHVIVVNKDQRAIVPVALFTHKQQIALANLPTPLVCFLKS